MHVTVSTEDAGDNPRNGDEKLRVQFYWGTLQNAAKSKEAGRAIFDDKPFVRIFIPGDKYSVLDGPVWEDDENPNSHTSRFRAKWLAFKAGQGEAESGTPLKMWPQVTRGQVEELAYLKVKTVEQLANMADGYITNFPGGFALRSKAQDFLLAAKSNAPMEKLRAELETRDSQLAAQQAQLTELAAALAKLQAQAPQQAQQKDKHQQR